MTSRYIAEYEKTADFLPGQSLAWLKSLRTEALNSFSEQDFPTLTEEEWLYTNVSTIENKLFAPTLNLT